MAVMVTQRSTVINEITVLFCVEKLISVFWIDMDYDVQQFLHISLMSELQPWNFVTYLESVLKHHWCNG